MSNVKGIGLTEEDFKRLLACVAAATKAFRDANDYEEAYKFMELGMKLTHFVDINVNGCSAKDDPAFTEFLRSMGGGGEGN